MAQSYLDKTGLAVLWNKIKALIPSPSSTTPLMDGTGNTGTSTTWARGDHVHPSDTSRVPTTRKINNKALSSDITLYGSDIKMSSSNSTTILSEINTLKDISFGSITIIDDVGEDIVLTPIANSIEILGGTGISVMVESPAGTAGNPYLVISTHTVSATHDGMMLKEDKSKLDSITMTNGVINSSVLPSFVDDVVEAYPRSGQTALSSTWLSATSGGSALTPETGKIYILMADSGDYSTNSQFRWSGSTYVQLSNAGVSAITEAEINTICV